MAYYVRTRHRLNTGTGVEVTNWSRALRVDAPTYGWYSLSNDIGVCYASAMFSWGDNLLVRRAYNGSTVTNTYHKYHVPTRTWSLLPFVDTVSYSASAPAHASLYNDKLLVLGATTTTTATNIIDLNTNQVINGPVMPNFLHAQCAHATVGDKLYIFGCYQSNYLYNNLMVFDWTSNTWSYETATIPFYAYNNSAVVCGQYIYVLGGFGGANYTPSCNYASYNFRFNTVDRTWTRMADMPAAFYVFSAWHHNNYIYTSFGYSGLLGNHNRSYRYNIATDTWEQLANAPVNMQTFGSSGCVHNNNFYTIGGYNGSYLSNFYCYVHQN